jgi:hypothetical protein
MRDVTAKKVSIPTLEERVECLMEELEEALDALAEERRPKGPCGMPATVMRRMMDAKGFGDCKCKTYLCAMEKNS